MMDFDSYLLQLNLSKDLNVLLKETWNAAVNYEKQRCLAICDKWAKANWIYVNGALQCAHSIKEE